MSFTVHFEKTALSFDFDVKARRIEREIEVFFPIWKSRSVKAFTAEVFTFVFSEKPDMGFLDEILNEVFADPLHRVCYRLEEAGRLLPEKNEKQKNWWCLEKRFRAGVTDNTGLVTAECVRLLKGFDDSSKKGLRVFSGARLCLDLGEKGASRVEVEAYNEQVFHNRLIESAQVKTIGELLAAPSKEVSHKTGLRVEESANAIDNRVETFDLVCLSDLELERLSQKKLWALSLSEMKAIQKYFSAQKRNATDVELEILAQTWSEHCKHKILAAEIEVNGAREGVALPKKVNGIFRTFIKGATEATQVHYLRSVFHDNAGVIAIDESNYCAIKVETHNSPSALDPYGGALTGIVGVNRDILGVGLGARPIANLDVFCVGPTDFSQDLPERLHHPRRILEGVRVGVEHGGNKSGIPTVTGAVVEHEGYLGKPLVYCGTLGLLPADDRLLEKKILDGDAIVVCGGRVGKDGIHGATFSSLEMNEDSPVSAVQLGDPLTQKRVADFLLEARDRGLFRAVTDNGAGGISSSVGELARLCGDKGGAELDVGKALTKYPGLVPYEVVISESQERMTFAVAPERLNDFLSLAASRSVECSVMGVFKNCAEFRISYLGEIVGRLAMDFLHDGVPKLQLSADVSQVRGAAQDTSVVARLKSPLLGSANFEGFFCEVLSHPNVRSRRDLVRQYDHEVQARTCRKPYGSRDQRSPCDGGALVLSRRSMTGVAVGVGIASHRSEEDAYLGTMAAVDEAVRNALCAGLNPNHAALVDNFCWPDPLLGKNNTKAEEAQKKMGDLVLAGAALFECATVFKMPFVSGKDSMKNDYNMGGRKISIPPTVLVTAYGKVDDVRKTPQGFFTKPRLEIFWVSAHEDLSRKFDRLGRNYSAARAKLCFEKLHQLSQRGDVEAWHDVSDGGLLSATAEMFFGTGLSGKLRFSDFASTEMRALFSEPLTAFVLGVEKDRVASVREGLSAFGLRHLGETGDGAPELEVFFSDQVEKLSLERLLSAYEKRLT